MLVVRPAGGRLLPEPAVYRRAAIIRPHGRAPSDTTGDSMSAHPADQAETQYVAGR